MPLPLGNEPNQEELRKTFSYDGETGTLYWRINTKVTKAGCVAGSVHHNRYVSVGYKNREWRAHRLVWVYVNGPIPAGLFIDHINGNGLDNRIENLRLASCSENLCNRSSTRSSKTGVKGVSWSKRNQKYEAVITKNNRQHFLGYFDTIEEAAAAYDTKALELHGNFARLNSSLSALNA